MKQNRLGGWECRICYAADLNIFLRLFCCCCCRATATTSQRWVVVVVVLGVFLSSLSFFGCPTQVCTGVLGARIYYYYDYKATLLLTGSRYCPRPPRGEKKSWGWKGGTEGSATKVSQRPAPAEERSSLSSRIFGLNHQIIRSQLG